MNRRQFIKIGLGTSAAIVAAPNLMKIWLPGDDKILAVPSFIEVCSLVPGDRVLIYDADTAEVLLRGNYGNTAGSVYGLIHPRSTNVVVKVMNNREGIRDFETRAQIRAARDLGLRLTIVRPA